jgi:hypothetical protein
MFRHNAKDGMPLESLQHPQNTGLSQNFQVPKIPNRRTLIMSNVKLVAEQCAAQDLDAAVIAFKAADGWREDMGQMWLAIREAALAQFAFEPPLDSVAGGDSY